MAFFSYFASVHVQYELIQRQKKKPRFILPFCLLNFFSFLQFSSHVLTSSRAFQLSLFKFYRISTSQRITYTLYSLSFRPFSTFTRCFFAPRQYAFFPSLIHSKHSDRYNTYSHIYHTSVALLNWADP